MCDFEQMKSVCRDHQSVRTLKCQGHQINMKICSLLMLFVVMCHGRLIFSKAETKVIEATEGENFTAQCLGYLDGNRKIFCKNDCKGKEDILVETASNRLQNRRYGTEVTNMSQLSKILFVNITNVRKSDAGRYKCGLEYGKRNATDAEFLLKVINVETPTPGLTLRAAATTSLHNVTSAQTIQRTQVPSEVTSPHQPQEEHNSSTLSAVPLYVGATVTTIVIVISGSILIWCWKRKTNRPTEDPTAADDCETPEMSRLYEEIPGQIRSDPVEICTSFSAPSAQEQYKSYRRTAVRESADGTYQSLCVDTMDPNQTYSFMRPNQDQVRACRTPPA